MTNKIKKFEVWDYFTRYGDITTCNTCKTEICCKVVAQVRCETIAIQSTELTQRYPTTI